ncbi:ATP-binding protein [uncultured Rheinheimera sp.]|uniref:sensor histidine kinase n=1 Tax=uncultured Rheinheimera sp. TaxID=400532 RepID=UPI0025937927|nr:ATP-binding protein [uncultured Rheinheimera sp.]
MQLIRRLYLSVLALLIPAFLLLGYLDAQPLWYALFIGFDALVLLLLRFALTPLLQEIEALNLHAQNLQDGSFNVDANRQLLRELRPLAEVLQHMSAQLRQERATLYQRELLLDTVLQSSPSAMVLTDQTGRVLMTNPAARVLLHQGQKFEGLLFSDLTAKLPELSMAIQSGQQGLLHLGEPVSIWHLSVSSFSLNQKPHQLYLLKPMTREIHREEVKAWKKLLRVIGHELNNTLAPLSSLAYSGQLVATELQHKQLQQIFQTISERQQHLNQFLQSYIQFAKLPKPALAPVPWARLINQLQDQYDFELLGDLPRRVWQADSLQLSQLLLNLLKNAHESGSAPEYIQLSFNELPEHLLIRLQDAGGGMSSEALAHAMVPFYTSKENGSGIGLTLCRDIAEAHGGSLSLQNQGAGLLVILTLPDVDTGNSVAEQA